MAEQSRLSVALAVSLLLHGLLLTLLPMLRNLRTEVPTLPPLLDVDIAPPPKAAPPPASAASKVPNAPPAQEPPSLLKNQIVAPPDAGEEKPPPDQTRLLSDRDNVVPEEKVRRSNDFTHDEPKPAPAPDEPKLRAAEEKPAAKPAAPMKSMAKQEPERVHRPSVDANRGHSDTQVASLPKLDQLLPQPGDLAAGALAHGSDAAPTPAASAAQRRLLMGGNHDAFSTSRGTNDFLPGIREGDITLLNTKAERFAPFVRRVASRIFQHLDIRLRQSVGSSQVKNGHEYAVVEAIMSKQGQLVRAHVVERQSTSSLGVDRILLDVTEPDTFFDENPPPGAEANDGAIHFVLLVDLTVQSMQDPRSGRVVGGYHGMAGVGLDTAPEEHGSAED